MTTGTNDNEDGMSSTLDTSVSTETNNDPNDSVFRSPNMTMSLRGRKRKTTYAEDFDYSTTLTPKRGRPKGAAAAVSKKAGGSEKRPRIAGVNAAGGTIGHVQHGITKNPDPSGLFNLVKGGKNLSAVVDDWITFYENEPDNAIVKILQLIITCCGCSGQIDTNMLHTMDYKDIIAKLTEEFDEDSGDYPLILLGAQWKKFRTNFADFLMLLAMKCKSSIIYDVSLMDGLIQLLTGLADSQVRAFRHTATFAAMKLSSAIVDIVVELVESHEKNALQIDTEKTKLKQMGTNERLDILLGTKTDLDSKIEELCSMLQYMFKSVFVHRYRDIVPDIRCICINELGNWMRVYPAFFLEDSYLKYIGWSLFDKYSDVRLKCVASLLTLYEREDLVYRLELFTNKFKDRLVSMVMDADTEVAIKTCQLMSFIYRAFPTLLDVKDCIPIYEIVYCNNRSLALAAGEFLNTKVFAANNEIYHTNQRSPSISPDHRRQLLIDLVTFYIEGQLHHHAAYLVDSLIDITPILKDWQVMVDLLLSDESDHFDTQLIDIMCCAIKQAATGENPIGRSTGGGRRGIGAAVGSNSNTASKDARLLNEERIRISEALIPALPKLMARFIADQNKIVNLSTIPLHFQLEIYPSARLGLYLDDLMNNLLRIVEQHSDDEILKNVAQVIDYFTTNIAVAQQIEATRLHLIDSVALQLRQGMKRFVDEDQLDEEDEAALLASYRKMAAFSLFIDIRKWDHWDMTLNMLNNSNRFQSVDLAEKGILLLCQSIIWELKHVIIDQEFTEETIQRLRRRRDQFLYSVKIMLRDGAAGVECAFLSLCDVLILFNWKLAADFEDNELIKGLPIKLDAEYTHRICSFVVDNVFVSEEDETLQNLDTSTQFQLLNKRRNILGQYCKLIIYGVLPVVDASTVLSYYTKFYNDYGDLLKILLQKCREMDKVSAAKAVTKALINAYQEVKIISLDNYVDPTSEQFCGLKELAKRFALSFGPDSLKNREAFAMIHKDGIFHALELEEYKRTKQLSSEPKNISFLEVLIEFSSRLVKQDKMAVLQYLEKHCPIKPEPSADDPHWQPYLLYKNSLTINKTAA